jgi:hypothetical protein
VTTPDRFPLAWPTGWPRTPRAQRQRARFASRGQTLSVADGLKRLSAEVDRLGARYALVSSNVEVRLDGWPRSGQPEPADVGVALYFQLHGQARVLACDRWTRVADNLAAIAQHIDALRRIDRYGVGTMAQAFAGYTALPAQASPWWTVLEFADRPTSLAAVEQRHTELARRHHPDRGGSLDTMAKINAARDAARRDLEGAAHARHSHS